ncbi:LacI family DNA-binding transcriptional regulator [Homoserinibacter sp. GY 40078]|uniref:LacI family DNA-binding transcriptional regulator n=1 Tax=Homoserinibacter sp. GY 40078 TaxID=2603275 RepID=UPI0011CB5DBD|nr:LacI family DNA-binding transcriptional regulator [Homoserinibacter sp. GY 40078]TXK18629.1 LacI family transcriptional regulator [Homoserinibacter sp. GY 40078]
MVRLKDVAARAGVSVSVASRALTDDAHARISADTRARIVAAATELGYQPDHRARALRLSRSGAIALVVPEVNNAIFGGLHSGIQEACQQRHTAVLLGQLNASDRSAQALSRLIGNGRVDGVILQRAEDYDDASLQAALDIPVPTVLFNSRLSGRPGSVVLDDPAAVRIAVEHLRELGHTGIGFIAGAAHHDAAARRLEAFTELMAGEPSHPEWTQSGGWEAPAGHLAMSRILGLDERPTAIVVASLNAAVGALHACAAAGVRVPDDLSIVSIHDAWIASYTAPELTTVRMPMVEAGERAATMLLDHLDGAELEDVVLHEPKPELLARGSSAAPTHR